MFLRASTVTDAAEEVISMRCPACRQNGTFVGLGGTDKYLIEESLFVGHRRCPNRECETHVFVVRNPQGLVTSYPPEVIDFDPVNVPTEVVAALEEAIKCHANDCYTAAAIMVRKTLEELCADRGATGDNLKQRIEALGSKVVLPPELLEGLDDLRLLGNDAAHIESNVYKRIGREEVEVGIEFAKEVLKAAYQMAALLAKLRGLKAQHETEAQP